MAISGNRMSTYTQVSNSTENDRPKSGDNAKKDIWSSMLDGVASGKRLPEKNILVLGGTPDSQKEFLDSLSSDNVSKRVQDRHSRKQPPVANNFALGYTYVDVLDADHEDILARLSVYLLADSAPAFASLLQPLLTPFTIPNTLIVILLDWSQPWSWLRQLRNWIRLLRKVLVSLDEDCKAKMEEVMISWRDRSRGAIGQETGNIVPTDSEVNLPLGPGEWEEALGLPLCVVCQNADQMEVLEKERAWKEEEFDFVLQFLRTVLLKHGASLIYTIPSVASSLPALVHYSLNIHSLLKKQPLKHNVIDRDKVLVPPNWDSWGKIRVLREGFDVEGINGGWSLDIEDSSESLDQDSDVVGHGDGEDSPVRKERSSALSIFEDTIRDPGIDSFPKIAALASDGSLGIVHLDAQTFLASQVETLERIKHGAETSAQSRRKGSSDPENGPGENNIDGRQVSIEEGKVNEHIGPVQFNMGGIQVDADDMLQRLKDRQNHQTPEPETSPIASPEGKSQNEALASFFAGLMKRGGGNTSGNSKLAGQ